MGYFFHFNSREGQAIKSLTLYENFFTPKRTFDDVFLVDELGWGMTDQIGQSCDNAFASDVLDHLLESGGNVGMGGMDLVALNIQRGRDHGLPGYNVYRDMCTTFTGLKKAKTWSDLEAEDLIPPQQVENLKKIYR